MYDFALFSPISIRKRRLLRIDIENAKNAANDDRRLAARMQLDDR